MADDEEPATKRARIDTQDDADDFDELFGDVPLCSTPKVFEEEEEEEEGDLDLDFFGLNEESMESFLEEVDAEEPSLNWLPNEILELIFCHLPLHELITTCQLVCQRWKEVISREKFLHWKKTYYKLKSGRCLKTTTAIHRLMREANLLGEGGGGRMGMVQFSAGGQFLLSQHSAPTAVISLVKHMEEEFQSVKFGEGTLAVLESHPHYQCVQRMAELRPELRSRGQLSVVGTIILLVLCSQSVHHVQWILATLLTPRPEFQPPLCNIVEMVEVFYCLATLLFALWNDGVLPPMAPRFHYFVFYSLHVLERSGRQVQCQQSLPSTGSSDIQMTAEQYRIINYHLRPGEVIKVMALAGTGKTTTLLRMAALHPEKSILYCVYNKSVQEHASSLFPDVVSCRTFHSLAFEALEMWKHRNKQSYNLTAHNISQWVTEVPLRRGQRRQESLYVFSKYVLKTVLNFIASSSERVSLQHLPRVDPLDTELKDWVTSNDYAAKIVSEAKKIWEGMKDMRDKKIKITHDGYLKVYQLTNPKIRKFDLILVDEAQDLTPAIVSILMAQPQAKILVGDPHQQIYGFRGAHNALTQLPASQVFYLTQSFRFGPEIAYVAACLLDVLKGVRRQTIVGGLQEGGVCGRQKGQLAIIARCNATLFVEMVKVCDMGQSIRVGFAGGIERYDFDMLLDIHKLLQGADHSQITHKFVKVFKSFLALRIYADRSSDVALINKIKTCERFYSTLPKHINQLRKMAVSDNTFADIIFSTAHKSKGLEFDTVKLTDDYLEIREDDPNSTLADLPADERNVLYVAATRAKRELIMTPTLLRVLNQAGEFFVYPSPDPSDAQLRETTCSLCALQQPLPGLPLRRMEIQLSGTPRLHAGGLVCKMCSCTVLPALSL